MRNVEEAMAGGSMSGVRDTMKELPINLERFKESLGLIVGRSNTKANIQKEWEKKGLQASQKALDCADKFLQNAGVKPLQEAYLKLLQGAMDRITDLTQLVEDSEWN